MYHEFTCIYDNKQYSIINQYCKFKFSVHKLIDTTSKDRTRPSLCQLHIIDIILITPALNLKSLLKSRDDFGNGRNLPNLIASHFVSMSSFSVFL